MLARATVADRWSVSLKENGFLREPPVGDINVLLLISTVSMLMLEL